VSLMRHAVAERRPALPAGTTGVSGSKRSASWVSPPWSSAADAVGRSASTIQVPGQPRLHAGDLPPARDFSTHQGQRLQRHPEGRLRRTRLKDELIKRWLHYRPGRQRPAAPQDPTASTVSCATGTTAKAQVDALRHWQGGMAPVVRPAQRC